MAGGGEANGANGMCEASKCHACGPCWQAHAAPHSKPLTDALGRWILSFSSLPSGALCSLTSKDWNVQPQNMPGARSFVLLFVFKQPYSLDKGHVSQGGATPKRRLQSSHPPACSKTGILVLSCPVADALRDCSGSRAFCLGCACSMCQASSTPRTL